MLMLRSFLVCAPRTHSHVCQLACSHTGITSESVLLAGKSGAGQLLVPVEDVSLPGGP